MLPEFHLIVIPGERMCLGNKLIIVPLRLGSLLEVTAKPILHIEKVREPAFLLIREALFELTVEPPVEIDLFPAEGFPAELLFVE